MGTKPTVNLRAFSPCAWFEFQMNGNPFRFCVRRCSFLFSDTIHLNKPINMVPTPCAACETYVKILLTLSSSINVTDLDVCVCVCRRVRRSPTWNSCCRHRHLISFNPPTCAEHSGKFNRIHYALTYWVMTTMMVVIIMMMAKKRCATTRCDDGMWNHLTVALLCLLIFRFRNYFWNDILASISRDMECVIKFDSIFGSRHAARTRTWILLRFTIESMRSQLRQNICTRFSMAIRFIWN